MMAFMILSTLKTNAAFRPWRNVVRLDAGASLRRSGGSAEGEENIERLSVLSVWRCLCGAAQFLTALAAAAAASSASPR
jgi:hypothetical protein